MDRRDFLRTIGYSSLILVTEGSLWKFASGNILPKQEIIKRRAMDSVVEHILKYNVNIFGEKIDYESTGLGFVNKDKYITLAHITHAAIPMIRMPPMGSNLIFVENERVTIDDVVLPPIIENQLTDVAVYQIPLKLQGRRNEGFEISNEYFVGDEVFWIGNKKNEGGSYSEGKIKKLNVDRPPNINYKRHPELKDREYPQFKGSVGLSKLVFHGDSGGPVFKMRTGELIGVIQWVDDTGYFKKIEHFEPYLDV